DILIYGTDLEQVQMTKKLLSENFDIKDLGEADVILGIKILRNENRLIPDIAYAVGRLSRHTSSPGKEHWYAVNRVFKYLKKTMDYGLEYSKDPSVLEVSWGSKKQCCLIDSTMAAEFVALTSCYKEAEWLRDFYGNILDNVHLSECGSEAASYELKGLALKHSEKPRYRPKALAIRRENQSKQNKKSLWLDISFPLHPKIKANDHYRKNDEAKDDQDSLSSKTIIDQQEEDSGVKRSVSNTNLYNNNDGSGKKLKLTMEETTLLEDRFNIHSTLNTFDSKVSMESVIENGPWLIRLVPLFLNIWTPNTVLKKDVIKQAPVWVKLHHVLTVAYSEWPQGRIESRRTYSQAKERFKAVSLALEFEAKSRPTSNPRTSNSFNDNKPSSYSTSSHDPSKLLATYPNASSSAQSQNWESERQNLRDKGLCFRCKDKFAPGHRCKLATFSLLEISNDNE
ncbi:zinc finger, CCHC-type containing protein, partial [Tanacetum coccineum]